MGCDIHLFAEKKKNKFWDNLLKVFVTSRGRWVSIDKYSRNPDFGLDEGEREFIIDRKDRIYTGGRNYNLFCALAGVRRGCFKDNPPIASEPKGLPKDCCPEIKAEADRWEGDAHSHSWLTFAELMAFDWNAYGTTCNDFVKEVWPKLREATSDPKNVRIVFFFDN